MSSTDKPLYTNQDPAKGPGSFGFWGTLEIIKKVFLDRAARVPKQKLPETKPNLTTFLEPSEKLKFIWFGHSTLLLNLDQKIILIDPVFSGAASPFSFLVKRFQPAVLSLKELPSIDLILISHDHYDHLDEETIRFFQEKKTEFIVPKGVGEHLTDWGISHKRITELSWDESKKDQTITFTAAPAQHFSGRGLFDRNETLWVSWIIKGETQNLYYSGDSGYGPHFKEIGDQHGPFDFAFIENGQYNERWPDVHMQPEDALQAQIDLNAHTIIPVHWGMFDLALHHWSEPITRIHKIAKAWHIPIITPRLGEVIDTEAHKNINWWEEAILSEEELKELTPMRELAIK